MSHKMKKRGFFERQSINNIQTTSNMMAQTIKKVVSGVRGFSGISMGLALADAAGRNAAARNTRR
ncbi:MAG: hypothetical protein WBS33_16910 [Verrucomicrobiia bacterium]